MITLDLGSSRAEPHIGLCISSNYPCPAPHRKHPPTCTSVPILADLRRWSLASSSSVFSFPLSPIIIHYLSSCSIDGTMISSQTSMRPFIVIRLKSLRVWTQGIRQYCNCLSMKCVFLQGYHSLFIKFLSSIKGINCILSKLSKRSYLKILKLYDINA